MDPPGEELETELLIGRMIDGEASEPDRRRFERLAATEPSLWRRLALGQRDMALLDHELRTVTATAAGRDLPRRWLFPGRLTWPLALAGWAAMLILALTWWTIDQTTRMPGRAPTGAAGGVVPMTHEQHFSEYMNAPYVLGDMQPEVLEVEEIPDGRLAVRFARRVEEVIFVDPRGKLPVDESGRMLKDLSSFRPEERPAPARAAGGAGLQNGRGAGTMRR